MDDSDRKVRVDIANKATMQEHLRLIRLCTSDTSSIARPASATHAAHQVLSGAHGSAAAAAAAAAAAKAGGEQPSKRVKVANDTGLHGGEKIESVSAEAFRIKNRSPGGVRVVKPGTDHKTANNLYILDQVREFHDRLGPAKGSTLTVSGPTWKRKLAEAYAKELGLSTEGKGEYPNRAVLLRRPVVVGEDMDVVSSGDAPEDVFAGELKRRMRTQDDGIATAMGEDEVCLEGSLSVCGAPVSEYESEQSCTFYKHSPHQPDRPTTLPCRYGSGRRDGTSATTPRSLTPAPVHEMLSKLTWRAWSGCSATTTR